MTHHHKAFIAENEVPGFLDGPKCVVPYDRDEQQGELTIGEARQLAGKLGYVVLCEPRVGLLCDVGSKTLHGHSHAANNLVRCAAFEVRKA